MTNRFATLGAVLMIASWSAMADIRDMQAGDPNLDPNWNWKPESVHNL